jgi:hypothetical protein
LYWVFFRYGLENYFSRLALNHILLISVSWVARITGMSHQCLTIQSFPWNRLSYCVRPTQKSSVAAPHCPESPVYTLVNL